MKISRRKLQKIINEEYSRLLAESNWQPEGPRISVPGWDDVKDENEFWEVLDDLAKWGLSDIETKGQALLKAIQIQASRRRTTSRDFREDPAYMQQAIDMADDRDEMDRIDRSDEGTGGIQMRSASINISPGKA